MMPPHQLRRLPELMPVASALPCARQGNWEEADVMFDELEAAEPTAES